MSFWPSSLVRELADRRGIVFVGAGVSVAASREIGLKFPDWPTLLVDIAGGLKTQTDKNYVRRLIRNGKYLEAAQVVRDRVPEADFAEKIRTALAKNSDRVASVYEAIVNIDQKVIITTNYDTLLEGSLRTLSPGVADLINVCRFNQDHILDDVRSPTRAILKIHGCVSEPHNAILTRRSYFEARRKYETFFSCIQALMLVNTVLFVGYSISNPDIQLFLENINLERYSKKPHYALMQKAEHASIRDINRNTYNIHPLEYPTGEHHFMLSRLAELSELVKESRAARGVV